MQIAAVVCALFAAIGIADGIHTMAPDMGWWIPALAGIAVATGFAILWHVVIHAITGMVKAWTIIALFVAAVVLTVAALGASAQGIATAVAGRSAVAAELTEKVDTYAKALSDAYTNATSWRGVAEAAQVLAVGYEKQAEMERNGGHGNGKGQGPKYTSLMEASGSFRQGAESMQTMLDTAKEDQARGNSQLTLMREAASHGDQTAFMAAAGEIGSVIGNLNAVDPSPIIESTGTVTVTPKGIDLSADTAKWEAKAKAAVADRKPVDVPTFRAMTPGEATRAQMFGSAMHGWILAGVIDILPLFFLILAFIFSCEPWHNEEIVRHNWTRSGQRQDEEEALRQKLGRHNHENLPDSHSNVAYFRPNHIPAE